jgi:hypothetical protein
MTVRSCGHLAQSWDGGRCYACERNRRNRARRPEGTGRPSGGSRAMHAVSLPTEPTGRPSNWSRRPPVQEDFRRMLNALAGTWVRGRVHLMFETYGPQIRIETSEGQTVMFRRLSLLRGKPPEWTCKVEDEVAVFTLSSTDTLTILVSGRAPWIARRRK